MTDHGEMENHRSGPRRVRICDDAFFDLLHFLHRLDHQRVNLVNRRLCGLSASVERRYPPRVIRALLIVGTLQSEQIAGCQSAVQPHRFVGNSISACPSDGPPYPVDFATALPPANISRILELEICDFIGPQLIQFLRVAASLLDGCCLIFDDFENFVQFHSVHFIRQFFALFPTNRCVELRFTSSFTVPIFTHHPTLFGCIELGIECTADFPLDCLYGWLCQDALEGDKRRRCLDIRFNTFVHVKKCLDSMENFVNFVRQSFLQATDWCPFCVEIELLGGPHIPELDTFTELNERTGEQLAFTRDTLARLYFLERRRWDSEGTEEEGPSGANGVEGGQEDGDVQHDVGESVYSMYRSVVFIRQILQGDISTNKLPTD